MEEIKLSGNNRLPKYWAVQCPSLASSDIELFRSTVIKYMGDVLHSHWSGDSEGYYYGNAGDYVEFVISAFPNIPTLLTLQEFIDCFKEEVKTPEFVLPEKWCIWRNPENAELLNKWNMTHPKYIEQKRSDSYLNSDDWFYSDRSHSRNKLPEYVEITFEQFKKYVLNQTSEVMSKECEIEEFKVPEKWGVKITDDNREVLSDWRVTTSKPSGGRLQSGAAGRYITNTYEPIWTGYVCDYLPKGYTEVTFEQFINYIYNSTNKTMKGFAIIGSTSLKEAFIREAGLGSYSPTSASGYTSLVPGGKHNQVQGSMNDGGGKYFEIFNLPTQWDAALTYVKKYYTVPESKVLYFGELKLTIKDGEDFATTKYGNISKTEIQKVLKLFNAKMSICGYDLKIENVDDIRLAFGCQNGTIGEAKALLEAFNTK